MNSSRALGAVKKLLRKTFGSSAREEPPFVHNEQYQSLDRKTYGAYNDFRPEGPKKLFCYVPFNNMSFSFKGRVLACAYNQKVELGHYPRQSIRDMWFNSEMGNRLRDHMEHNDLNYGCKHCKYFVEHGKFSGLKPLVFDKYSQYSRNEFPRVMEFELANTCNFECVMCNGEVSSSIRKNRDKLPPLKSPYDDAFVDQLEEFIPHLQEAKFYGGEPFYIPVYFKIWDRMLKINPKIKLFVITNGSILTPQVKEILERGDFDIGVSMDSTRKEVIESIRLNVEYETLLENISYLNDYCKRKGKKLVISFTMMRINYAEFPAIIEFCNSIGAILYVSYLKTPPRFAIWNLPVDTLRSIREEMEKHTFPGKTYAEKNNLRCHADFITYLKNCEQDNLVRSPEEIIPMNSDMKAEDMASVSEYQEMEDYKAALLEVLELDEECRRAFFEKIETAMTGLPEDAPVNKVYYSIFYSQLHEVIRDVETTDTETLREQIRKLLYPASRG